MDNSIVVTCGVTVVNDLTSEKAVHSNKGMVASLDGISK